MEIKLFGVKIMYLYFPKILDLPICQSYFEKKIRDWMQNVRLLYTITVNYSGGDTVSCTCSTFEFPSRVNLFGLYCTWTGKAGATRLTRSDFMIHTIDLLLLQICVEKVNLSWYYCYLTLTWLLLDCYLTVTTLWPRCSSRSDFKQKCNKTRFSLLYIMNWKHCSSQ